jgi:hypothetical protein
VRRGLIERTLSRANYKRLVVTGTHACPCQLQTVGRYKYTRLSVPTTNGWSLQVHTLDRANYKRLVVTSTHACPCQLQTVGRFYNYYISITYTRVLVPDYTRSGRYKYTRLSVPTINGWSFEHSLHLKHKHYKHHLPTGVRARLQTVWSL